MKSHVGALQRGEHGLVADAEIGAVRILPKLDCLAHVERRRDGAGDDQAPALLYIWLESLAALRRWRSPGRPSACRSSPGYPPRRTGCALRRACGTSRDRRPPSREIRARRRPAAARAPAAVLADVILFVLLEPGEDGAGGFERGPVLLLERAVDIDRRRAAIGDVLPQSGADLLLRAPWRTAKG